MIDDSPEGNLIDTIIASVMLSISNYWTQSIKSSRGKAKPIYPGNQIGYINVINPSPAGKFDKRTIDIDPERGHI